MPMLALMFNIELDSVITQVENILRKYVSELEQRRSRFYVKPTLEQITNLELFKTLF